MSFLEFFMIAVGLSMDAFAVSICKGLSLPKMRWKYAVIAGIYFGGLDRKSTRLNSSHTTIEQLSRMPSSA